MSVRLIFSHLWVFQFDFTARLGGIKCFMLDASELRPSPARRFSRCVLNLTQVLHEPPQTAVERLPREPRGFSARWTGEVGHMSWCGVTPEIGVNDTVVLFSKMPLLLSEFFWFLCITVDVPLLCGCSFAYLAFFLILSLFFPFYVFKSVCTLFALTSVRWR